MNKFFSDKLLLTESIIILLALFSYYLIGIQNKNLYPDFIINIIFISLLLVMFIFKSSSPRHMYFGFIFLVLSAIANTLEFSNFVYIGSSLSLSLFILGVLNMLLFKPESEAN